MAVITSNFSVQVDLTALHTSRLYMSKVEHAKLIAEAIDESRRMIFGYIHTPGLMPIDEGVLYGGVVEYPTKSTYGGMQQIGSIGSGLEGQQVEYIRAIEYGRRPGSKRPPIEEIKSWCIRHGIDPRAAYFIARQIGRIGYKSHPRGWAMWDATSKYAQEIVPKIFERKFKFV